MRMFIKSPNGDTACLEVDPVDTIGEISARIENKYGFGVWQQCWSVEQELIDDEPFEFIEDASEDEMAGDSASGEEEEADEDELPADQEWSFEDKKKVVDFYLAKPGRTYKSVKQRFKRVRDPNQLSRFKKQVAAGGTKREKWARVASNVLNSFIDARQEMLPVHDADLRRWALASARTENLTTGVNDSWVTRFKRRNGLVSRKVTKVWSAAKLARSKETEAAAAAFRAKVLQEAQKYPPVMVLNTDQSGYQYEYYSARTLSWQGEKETPIAARSMNKTTHSYTIQPTLALDGTLHSPLYLCTQELKGRMGPKVEPSYFRAKNVEVTCSSSGKLTTSLFERYVSHALEPVLTDNCLLLLDSWGGQQSDDSFSSVKEETGFVCSRLCIPPGATATTQPLDVYYNRPWKGVVKRFYDYVMANRLPINLYERDNIIKLQSLVHNQFSHQRFVPMGQYAFFAAGLRPDRPGHFERASDILFPPTLLTCANCPEKAFIRCCHCDTPLCFREFFTLYHTHF